MSIENLKSSDPFVDERDPFTKTEKAAPATHPRPTGSRVKSAKKNVDSTLDVKAQLAEDDDLGLSSLDLAETADVGSGSDDSIQQPSRRKAQKAETKAKTDSISHAKADDDLASLDPFQYEDHLAEASGVGSTMDDIHIRIQQRNGRKTLTTLQGLSKDVDVRKILKAFKKEFACNGTIIEDEMAGNIVQLQGDQRNNVYNFLIKQGVPKLTIRKHGF